MTLVPEFGGEGCSDISTKTFLGAVMGLSLNLKSVSYDLKLNTLDLSGAKGTSFPVVSSRWWVGEWLRS